MKPISLDYFGNPCKPYDGPPVPPVRIIECPTCNGIGYVDAGPVTVRCSRCWGRGRIATENGEV